MRHAAVRVPATTANLGPGFDSFGLAVSRHLWARSVAPGPQRVTTAVEGPGGVELPTGDDNLLWRGVVACCEAGGEPVPEVSVRVRTQIPLERGLGSSAAAIVAGLALGRSLVDARLGEDELLELAVELEGHADNVAPALLGGLVVTASGEDGPVVRRTRPAPRLRPVLLIPTGRQSTAEARGLLPEGLPREQVAVQIGRAGHVLPALLGLWPVDPAAAGDLLHEPARLRAMPAAGRLVGRLREAGVHAWLSGAGPAVAAAVAAGPYGQPSLSTCRQLAAGARVAPLEWDLAGAVVCPDGGCAWAAGPSCVGCPRAAGPEPV